jgi:uncharacterized protein YcbX
MTTSRDDARIGALALYPVKSCAGVALERADVDVTGLRARGGRDREWMVVDAGGRFVTQRECPALALVRVDPTASHLALTAPGAVALTVPLPSGAGRDVVVWRDTVSGIDAGDEVARWLAARLARDVRLVRFDTARRRPCDPERVGDSGAHTLFADGYPVLVAGRASLAELNRRLAAKGRAPVAMERFRPNVVVDGLEPHDEDHLSTIETAAVTLRLVKPCTRCTITTVDPATGEPGDEPLATLAGYRMDERWGGITFGMNAIVERAGPIAVGDAVRATFAF